MDGNRTLGAAHGRCYFQPLIYVIYRNLTLSLLIQIQQ